MVALLEQLNSLRRAPTWSAYKKDRMKDPYYSMSKREHRAIIAALDAQDGAAAFRAMKTHIMGVQDGFYGWAETATGATKMNV